MVGICVRRESPRPLLGEDFDAVLDLFWEARNDFQPIWSRVGRVVWGVNFVVEFVICLFVLIPNHKGVDDSFLLKGFGELVGGHKFDLL